MKRGSLLSIGLAALAVMISACSQSSNPTASGNNEQASVNGSPGILARLHNPEVLASMVNTAEYRLLFTAGASGTSDSEPMVAARTITTVDFEIHAPDGGLISRATSDEVVTTGVQGDEGVASLTVFADTEWALPSRLEQGTYVLGIVHGRNGEMLVTRADVPVRDDQ
jgi:hypothetical protein